MMFIYRQKSMVTKGRTTVSLGRRYWLERRHEGDEGGSFLGAGSILHLELGVVKEMHMDIKFIKSQLRCVHFTDY